MIPASNIGKHNYNALGNQLVGETHASRMKRVNAAQMQPMGLAIGPDPGAVADAAFYGVGGGFIGALAVDLLSNKAGNSTKGTRTTGAIVGAAAGAGASYLANMKNNNRTEGFGTDPVIESGPFRVATFGAAIIAGLAAMGIGGLDWKGMQRINPWTPKNLGTLAGAGIVVTGSAVALGASPNTMTALTVGATAALGGAYLAHQLGEAVQG